ncbi:MAG: hypothetical protein CVU89_06350 [Firmicutes bacterium HGW-Firmicutes-14]|nr:MAG: hypothetical protein CVU89_06350 [Firmicutes bacterium HGW-Firmicutes-14]
MTVGSKVKQTLASLKGIKSTLEVYALQTQDDETSGIYRDSLNIINEVMDDLEKRVQTLEFEEPQYRGL